MNREIKFRGKVDSTKSEWVNGYFVNIKEKGTFIVTKEGIEYPIIEGTECQYIGLKDSKRTKEYPEGQEIYEGDVVKYSEHRPTLKSNVANVVWKQNNYDYGFGLTFDMCGGAGWTPLLTTIIDRIEIIGNIYENPELLNQK